MHAAISRFVLLAPLALVGVGAGPATRPAPSTRAAAATTAPAGLVITVRKIDDSTVSGGLVGLDNGALVLSDHARVPLADVVEITPGGAPATRPANGARGHKLTGRVIGTTATAAGHGKANAFDGKLDTYYESARPNFSNAWLGLDLGAPKTITLLRFCPRPDAPAKMVGGRFEASNAADFTGDLVVLFSVPATPATGKLTDQPLLEQRKFRYVRYVGPPNSGATVNELEFWGEDEPGTPAAAYVVPTVPPRLHKLNGVVIGTEGSWNDEGRTRDNAFDGDLGTFFDAPAEHADDAWVGLDLGAPRQVTRIQYAARSGYALFADRTVGGKFQGSDNADFSGDVTELAKIAKRPEAAKLITIDLPAGGKAFRYVRYLSPPQGHGNISEVEFWGTGAVLTPVAGAAAAAAASQPQALSVLFGEDDQISGPVVAWTENGLRLQTRFGDRAELDVPATALREVWRGTPAQAQQAKALPLDPGPEDAAFVLKDNAVVAVRGIVLGIEGDALRFKFGDDTRKINLSKLVGVSFGGQSAKRDRSFKQAVTLSTGDTISGQWKAYDPAAQSLTLVTPWGAEVTLPMSAVTKVRSANGRLVYVSDLKPAAVEQTPYFDRILGYRIDKSLTGGALKLIDGEYAHGIAVHSRTVLTYDLAGDYAEFKAKVGFQQPEGREGQAVVRVTGDGKTLYEDLDARGDAPKPTEVSVNVAGVRQLALEVDYGKNQDTGDRVVWANARLLRSAKP